MAHNILQPTAERDIETEINNGIEDAIRSQRLHAASDMHVLQNQMGVLKNCEF